MVIHRGTHGTCYEWARSICENGFHPSASGHAGPGVYLWAYEEDPTTARTLAINWFQLADSKWKSYASVKEKGCTVIYAEFAAQPTDCLDCTTLSMEEALSRILAKSERMENEDLDAAYQTLVKRIEDKSNVTFKLIRARVSIPKGMPFQQKKLLGSPLVHVIRQEFDKITVTNCEQVAVA